MIMQSRYTRLVKYLFTVSIFFITTAIQPVHAKTITSFIYIPAGKLHESLQTIASVYDVPFSIDPSLVNNKTNPTFSGDYTLSQALDFLLNNSELTYKIQAQGFVIYKQKKLPIEEITVKGIRYALAQSQILKNNSSVISEAISAQDITDIPNTNLAEALQYIPGISITREAGEGRQVSIRGSYPDFSLVTLNGMPVLANNDSPMDSRIQKQRDRSFDFNILPAELFKHIQVFKSYSAEQQGGGISGTLGLQTVNPSDNDGLKFIVTPEFGYNDYTGSGAKRLSTLISNTWGNWGVLASLAYTDRQTIEQGANTFRWRNIAIEGADLTHLPNSIATGLSQGDYIIPRGNRYSVWQSQQQRFGANMSLEYKSATTHFDIDFLSGFLKGDRDEFHTYPRGNQSTPIINGLTIIKDVQLNKDNELVYASYKDARVATESRAQSIETTYQQAVMSVSHTINSKWKINALMGKEQSNFDIPYSNKIYTQGVSDVTIDYRDSPYYADINYSEDLQNPEMWQVYHGDLEQYQSHSQYLYSKMDIVFKANNSIHWLSGMDWTEFKNTVYNIQQEDIFFDQLTGSEQKLVDLPTHLISEQNQHDKLNWLKINTNSALAFYGVDPFILQNNIPAIASKTEQVLEHSRGIYTTLNIMQPKWEAHLGLRYQSETINAFIQTPYPSISYDLILPTFNSTYYISNDWKVRLGLSKNYAKPLLDSLNYVLQNEENDSEELAYVFNSQLKPYLSYNTDLAFEGRFNQQSNISFSLFYKHLKDYIVTTHVPSSQAQQFNNQEGVSLIWQDNAETAYQWGYELNLNYFITNSDWGINLQASYNKGRVTYYNQQTGDALFKKDLPYLSKVTASSMLFYENNKFNFKIGAIFRDRYLVRSGSLLNDEDETGFLPTTYWDASINYRLSPHWKVKFNAFNLTNEQERQYSNSTLRAYNSTTSGCTYYLGFSYQY